MLSLIRKEVFPETIDTVVDTITTSSLLSETGTVMAKGLKIVWDLIVSNPVLELFVGVSILSLGFVIFRKAKNAARR